MAKTKVLISCAVTAQLICVFVFAYANCWFSHAKAIFSSTEKLSTLKIVYDICIKMYTLAATYIFTNISNNSSHKVANINHSLNKLVKLI